MGVSSDGRRTDNGVQRTYLVIHSSIILAATNDDTIVDMPLPDAARVQRIDVNDRTVKRPTRSLDAASRKDSSSIQRATAHTNSSTTPDIIQKTTDNNVPSTLKREKAAKANKKKMLQRGPTTKGIRVRFRDEHRLQLALGWHLDGSNLKKREAQDNSLQSFYNRSRPSRDQYHFLWDNPEARLPDWMKSYLRWHQSIRPQLANETEAADIKFIVMQCLSTDNHCGGVSDRLKPLPVLIRWAYYSRRVLLIYWNRPGHLENFLLPPRGGMDWRAPLWLVRQMEDPSQGVLTLQLDQLLAWGRTNMTLVRIRYQEYHGGRYTYDEHLIGNEPDFASVFHDVWRLAFTPSPPVKAVLERDMTQLGLIPGRFVAAHLRVLYGVNDQAENIKRNWAINGMNCASELRPSKPIFFVSDSFDATIYARQYALERNATIITRTPHPNPPFHMDKVPDWRRRNMSDFFDSFIDIYIMASSDCVTYNKGGYGLLGLFMSRNSSCGLRQDAIGKMVIQKPCLWVDSIDHGTQPTRDSLPQDSILSNQSVYVEAMEEAALETM